MRIPPKLQTRAPSPTPTPRHCLLVNPFYPKDPHSSFGKHALTPTLALTSVAAATPSHWTVRYWDENLLQGPAPLSPFPEVVGITVHLTFAKRAYELARFYKRRGAKVILGGLHVQSCPDEAQSYADAIALGDGVTLWPSILRDVEKDRLKPRYAAEFSLPFRETPAPRRDLVDEESYLTTTSLIATRGCHNRCGFCYLATEGLRMPYQMRDPEQVAEEWRRENTPYAVFLDNNLSSSPRYLRKLCKTLAPLKRIWSAAVSIDVTNDPSLVREMALSGCVAVFVGFESLSPSNLKAAGKKTPLPDEYAKRVGTLHDYGISVNGSFVLGFDHDDVSVFENTAHWIEENRLECATFHILTPYPQTPLFQRLEAEGRLLHKNWDFYDTAHVVFSPARMTPDELARGYAWCYQRLFSAASIWRRRPQRISELPAYLAMSTLYKRSNALWPKIIERNITKKVWRPMIEGARRRHLIFRKKLAQQKSLPASLAPIYGGV